MRIFVISRKNAVNRRAEAVRQFSRLSLNFEFFDAVEGITDAFRYFTRLDRRLFKLNTGRSPINGEIGCFASHKALWQTCINLHEPIVILEDDFRLAGNFAHVLDQLPALVNRYGFIRLESYKRARKFFRLSQLRANYRLPGTHGNSLRYLSNVPLCLLAYAISPRAAAGLVDGSSILTAPVDKFMQKTWVHSTPVFAIEEPIVSLSACAHDSTIGARTEKSRNIALSLGRLFYKAYGEIQRSRFDRVQLKRLGISKSWATKSNGFQTLRSDFRDSR